MNRFFAAGHTDRLVVAGIVLLAIGVLAPSARSAKPSVQDSAGAVNVDLQALRSAMEDLTRTFGQGYAGGHERLARLAEFEKAWPEIVSGVGRGDAGARQQLEALRAFQREALLANPLLCRQPILFALREQYASDHHNTATIFQTSEINTQKFRGPGAIKTVNFGSGGQVRTLLEVPTGVARDLEVSFDGRHVLFSMRKDQGDDYHLYEIGSDGSGLRQLTSGEGVSDIDPLYLPDGRIAFTSTREPKYCMCNRHIMANLFRMDADGNHMHQVGRSTLFEGHGALLPDGRILYDRWEYVDRNFGDAQGLWTCNPDGTNHAVYWGNNTKSPGAVLDARPLPGSHQAIVVFSSCHDRPWGALAILDRRLGLDGVAPVIRTWPASAMDLVMKGNYDTFKKVTPKYEDPYPLSDKYFLCSRQTGQGEQTGIYLVDVFGNEVMLHAEGAGCFDPMPLKPRHAPRVLADRVRLERQTGRFYIYDVYDGTEMEHVERGTVKFLRVVESPEKRFWSAKDWKGAGAQAPGMNWHDFNNKRILGTVPVEADGSVYFEVPADRFVYFQLLDEKGMMIQSMRSGTIIRPDETQGCAGCHDNRHATVSNNAKLAIRQAPRKLKPWQGPERLFNYMSEVQPIFDKHCVSCHDYGKPDGEELNLARDVGQIFNVSYTELWRKKQIHVVGGGPAEVLPPYSWGSHASNLVKVLQKEHYDVRLDPESFDRIVTWIDINAPYYPSYASAYPNNLYGRSPLTDAQLGRLSELVGLKLKDQANVLQISFTRPELSPCLGQLRQANAPTYREAQEIIRAGAAMLAKQPRADMPDFQLVGADVQREEKYEALSLSAAKEREALLKRGSAAPAESGGVGH